MSYKPKYKEQYAGYMRERRKKLHFVNVPFEHSFYDEALLPAAKAEGKSVSAFITESVMMRLGTNPHKAPLSSSQHPHEP